MRKMTRPVHAGRVQIGGGAPISVQSMVNTRTEDIAATMAQIRRLVEAGCDILRISVYNEDCVHAIPKYKREYPDLPLVADIHFNADLALASIRVGADKIRINPGNIGSKEKVHAIARAAKAAGIPIRVGVNAGSLEKPILKEYGRTAEAMAESALRYVDMLAEAGFSDTVVSMKASNIPLTIEANRLFSRQSDCPLHLGITEAGTVRTGTIRSSVGLGILLYEGIGDTIRVSLSGDPVEEVAAGREILASLGLARGGVRVIACPTCGRTGYDVSRIAAVIEEKTRHITSPLTVAVMGCPVNGPGEARDADIGIAGGKGQAVLFQKGRTLRAIPGERAVEELLALIGEMTGESFPVE
jgi:(E)-4-hydroxy-3-methylbut-2-enyl-diphosphate synthase